MSAFQVGDRADHKSGRLDPRRVTRVEGDQIWIDILGVEAGPYNAADYDGRPGAKPRPGPVDSVDVSQLCVLVAELERKLRKSQSAVPKTLVDALDVKAMARVASQLDADALAAAREARTR